MPSDYLWVNTQRQLGLNVLLVQPALPLAQPGSDAQHSPAAWPQLPVSAAPQPGNKNCPVQGRTRSCPVLVGLWACGCAPACSRLALLRKHQGPFSEQPGSSGTDARRGKWWQALSSEMGSAQPLGTSGPCEDTAVLPGALSSWGHRRPGSRGSGTCWEQEGRVGRGACLLALPPRPPFPSRLSAAPRACGSPGSFVMPARLAPECHLHPPAQPARARGASPS